MGETHADWIRRVESYDVARIETEQDKCAASAAYFIDTYVWIESAEAGRWIRFKLWPAQYRTLQTVIQNRLSVILKARQLGLTWLVLSFFLWLMLFRPIAQILLFSKREDEAVNLLDERMKGMYRRLPSWLQEPEAGTDSKKLWELGSGSKARAFSTKGGDSYTATAVLTDEFDLLDEETQKKMLLSIKPTIDAGGYFVMLSRANKDSGQRTPFKQTYRAARSGANNYAPIFLPWHARPDRDQQWYDDIVADATSIDDVRANYPASDAEALSPRSESKRIRATWVDACYSELKPYVLNTVDGAPSIPDLLVYQLPSVGSQYVIGIDPAEGNPTSDDSSLIVLEAETGEEVAKVKGKVQPRVIASYAHRLAQWYNDAGILPERNNHGHVVVSWFVDNAPKARVLAGHDGRAGWLNTRTHKTRLYDDLADAFRLGDIEVHDYETQEQVKAIDGNTLKAPDGNDHDADALALANVARSCKPVKRHMQSDRVDFYG